MISTIFVKLGGSVITDKSKPYSIDRETIESLARELAEYKKPLVLFHGNGSVAHTSASQHGGKHGYSSKEGIAIVNRDVLYLHSVVVDIFVKKKINAVSFRPNSFMVASGGRVEEVWTSALFRAVSQGLVPVIPGDVVWDSEWKSTIFSGERVINILVPYFEESGYKVSKVIEVGETNGVIHPSGFTIDLIDTKNFKAVYSNIQKTKYTDVTGGMQHKVQEAMKRAELGIQTVIINGKVNGELTNALNSKTIRGTIITK